MDLAVARDTVPYYMMTRYANVSHQLSRKLSMRKPEDVAHLFAEIMIDTWLSRRGASA
jgi:hypothetical protein